MNTSQTLPQKLTLAASLVGSAFLLLGGYGIGFSLPTTPLEVWIFITGALAVWLAVREHPLNWPIGIINVFLWLFLFVQNSLFANAALQIFYIVTGLLGWYWWSHRKNGVTLVITNTPTSLLATLSLLTIALSYPVSQVLIRIGGAVTYWDGLTTLLSLVGQYLLMKKYRENWIFWIIADIVYISLFATQGLYLSAVLYSILLAMCFIGIRTWKGVDHV